MCVQVAQTKIKRKTHSEAPQQSSSRTGVIVRREQKGKNIQAGWGQLKTIEFENCIKSCLGIVK